MSISDTISQTAAANPLVGMAVATQSVKGAILAGLQTGDAAFGSLLGAAGGQALEASQLLAMLAPHLGRALDVQA